MSSLKFPSSNSIERMQQQDFLHFILQSRKDSTVMLTKGETYAFSFPYPSGRIPADKETIMTGRPVEMIF